MHDIVKTVLFLNSKDEGRVTVLVRDAAGRARRSVWRGCIDFDRRRAGVTDLGEIGSTNGELWIVQVPGARRPQAGSFAMDGPRSRELVVEPSGSKRFGDGRCETLAKAQSMLGRQITRVALDIV
jgi:hypothetical protein